MKNPIKKTNHYSILFSLVFLLNGILIGCSQEKENIKKTIQVHLDTENIKGMVAALHPYAHKTMTKEQLIKALEAEKEKAVPILIKEYNISTVKKTDSLDYTYAAVLISFSSEKQEDPSIISNANTLAKSQQDNLRKYSDSNAIVLFDSEKKVFITQMTSQLVLIKEKVPSKWRILPYQPGSSDLTFLRKVIPKEIVDKIQIIEN